MNSISSEQVLLKEVSAIIDNGRREISLQASREVVLVFWQVGKHINTEILDNERAEYGKQIVSRLATQLSAKYGRSFEFRNLRRMMQFAEQFPDFEIVSLPATQLSWSHFIEILPLKTQEAKLFYLNEAARGHISRDKLRDLIYRKAYERMEIANAQIIDEERVPINTFKDPYLFDILGLKEDYLESDLEAAIFT